MKSRIIVLALVVFALSMSSCGKDDNVAADRAYWVETLIKIADPVLVNLSENTLKKNMPYESLTDDSLRRQVSHLEAVSRTICGIAPWLELGPDDTPEGVLRAKYIDLAVKGISNAVNPEAPDYLVFDDRHTQPLVDAAFLAQGLLRAPRQLWGRLDTVAQQRVITELKRTRAIKPFVCNWLLFASMIEAALLEFSGEYDAARLYEGVDRFRDDWYKGDAWYGDGPEFHLDYYNSLVIHPMLTDVLIIMNQHELNMFKAEFLEKEMERLQRFAVQQERMISPEGTYPIIGRSITYRFGAFHALAQASLFDILPGQLPPAQVRSALTAVIKKQLESPANFDEGGWLTVGFAGHQINMSEFYINTGSEYLCTAVFLPLGLPVSHPFWADPSAEWTTLKAWKGIDVGRDEALN